MKENKFITGVHNYCDRWCERCPLSKRCFSYQTELESDLELDTATSEDIETVVKEQLASAVELLYEQAEVQGINLDDLPEEPVEEPEFEDEAFARAAEQLTALTMEYGTLSSEWFGTHQLLLQSKEEEFARLLELGVLDVDQTEAFRDALEVVIWYMHFIAAKIKRAVSSKKRFDPEIDDPEQNDFNGSAKVAILTIEKSLVAWELIYEQLKESSDDIIDLLKMLSRLRESTYQLFPDAVKFVRPGFDEVL
jgi:hypothetical protein